MFSMGMLMWHYICNDDVLSSLEDVVCNRPNVCSFCLGVGG